MTARFPAASFARLAACEDASFWFRSRNRLIVWALRRYFPAFHEYLEIGCGTGYVLSAVEAAFPAANIVGGEAHEAGLEQAARRVRRCRLAQLDAQNLPFRGHFEVIGCFDVLEHIEDDARVLRECCAALRHGGGIVITVPQHPFLWSASDEYARHVRRYTRKALLARLRSAGLQPLMATSFVSLLFPAMVLARLQRRSLDSRYDPHAEFSLGRHANALLERVLDAERALIDLGVRFPLGGSLLVVARKADVDSVQ
jgi:SAM-dependent methyltransferase